jgi:hypothetical protein
LNPPTRTVSETNLGKLFEAGTLLVGLAAFAWWQLRDLRKAKEKSAQSKLEKADQNAAKDKGGGHRDGSGDGSINSNSNSNSNGNGNGDGDGD